MAPAKKAPIQRNSRTTKHRSCEEPSCKVQPSYAFEGQKPRFCSAHKAVGMVDVQHRRCETDGCTKQPHFAIDGERAKFCSTHKQPGMINVQNRRCEEPKCTREPIYARPGERAKYCSTHKTEEMINVKSRRCVAPGCSRHPLYALEGQKAQYCSQHKVEGMMDVQSRKCEAESCKRRSLYGSKGSRARFCNLHKEEGMVIQRRRCEREECSRNPVFGWESDQRGRFCNLHKEEGMTDLQVLRRNAPSSSVSAENAAAGASSSSSSASSQPQGSLQPALPLPVAAQGGSSDEGLEGSCSSSPPPPFAQADRFAEQYFGGAGDAAEADGGSGGGGSGGVDVGNDADGNVLCDNGAGESEVESAFSSMLYRPAAMQASAAGGGTSTSLQALGAVQALLAQQLQAAGMGGMAAHFGIGSTAQMQMNAMGLIGALAASATAQLGAASLPGAPAQVPQFGGDGSTNAAAVAAAAAMQAAQSSMGGYCGSYLGASAAYPYFNYQAASPFAAPTVPSVAPVSFWPSDVDQTGQGQERSLSAGGASSSSAPDLFDVNLAAALASSLGGGVEGDGPTGDGVDGGRGAPPSDVVNPSSLMQQLPPSSRQFDAEEDGLGAGAEQRSADLGAASSLYSITGYPWLRS